MKPEIEDNNRRSASVMMQDAWHKDSDYIEVTEWSNGEGYDIDISGTTRISVHFTEWRVIKELIEHLDK